ncbi:transglutaminase domain-containing protein [Candidatus Woesearchaeota archaeon]|jgi:hypothetical protein|nr:transglutaminase domain-containing protein [Candidatus Woesearchaeota archaeon]
MKKNKLNILIFLLILIICSYSVISEIESSEMIVDAVSNEDASWVYVSDNVIVDLNINSGITIQATDSDWEISYLTTDLLFFPKATWKQKIQSFLKNPEPQQQTAEYMRFRWDAPVLGDYDFDIQARIKSLNAFKLIPTKVTFPITQQLSSEVSKYVVSTDNIDSDDDAIINIATQLAEGEDDLFILTHKIADWVRHEVEYDLSTLTADVSQKASWVLLNKQGVCDELTSLFVAMMRAVGVPAKFVSGISYTDDLRFSESWGAHGWAEVYFPGVGWVDFDVTYGEYGFINPTHIKLSESADSSDAATKYEWKGRNINGVAKELDVKTKLVSYSGSMSPLVSLEIKPFEKRVGLGSYNLIEVSISNLVDSYISTTLLLSKVQEIGGILEDDYVRRIALKPKELKKTYWLVKVKEGLGENFIYSFPLEVRTPQNDLAESLFISVNGETVLGKSQLLQLIDSTKKDEKKFNKELNLNCVSEKQIYYSYEEPIISCTLKNVGNVNLPELKLCLEGDCKFDDLVINQEKVYDFRIVQPQPGKNKLIFFVESDDVSKQLFFDLHVNDKPELILDETEFPVEVEYDTDYQIKFLLKKESLSEATNVQILIDAGVIKQNITEQTFNQNKQYVINLHSIDLLTDSTEFFINITYQDYNQRNYTLEEQFMIKLKPLTIWQKITRVIRQIDFKLRSWFVKDAQTENTSQFTSAI